MYCYFKKHFYFTIYLKNYISAVEFVTKKGIIYTCQKRQSMLSVFFSMSNDLTFCHDIPDLMNALSLFYKFTMCQLFNSSRTSLKVVLLLNRNEQPFVFVSHATNMTETYEHVRILLQNLKYEPHKRNSLAYLKVVALLIEMQVHYIKYYYFYASGTSEPETNIMSLNIDLYE